MIEELIPHLSNDELCAIVERAEKLLEKSRDVPKIERLAKSACRVVSLVHGFPAQPDWTTFDMKVVKHRQEAHFIELALKESGGSVTEAARLLGLAGHQSLLTMLRRHKELSKVRKPIRSRRRSVIETRKVNDGLRENASRKIQAARILHIEDDQTVAGIVKEMLENQGWQVETCADGNAALEKISGEDNYDVLLVNYDLPDMNGLEIINRARELDHRCATPMVVLAASSVEAAAREAGADVFLQKPQDVSSLVETINRLLEEREQED